MLKTLVVILVVMVAAVTSVPAVGNPGAECPDKFERVNEYCLHVFPGFAGIHSPSRPWDAARKLCQDLGLAGWSADLVILKDAAKLSIINKHIYDNYKAMHGHAWWIGARQVAVETSPWMWLDDTPVDSYSYMWIPNQPKANTTSKAALLVSASKEPFRLYVDGVSSTVAAPSFLCEAVVEYDAVLHMITSTQCLHSGLQENR